MAIKKQLLLYFILAISSVAFADDGYRLWLKYDKIQNNNIVAAYKKQIQQVNISGTSETIQKATAELNTALKGLLDKTPVVNTITANGSLIIGTTSANTLIATLHLTEQNKITDEGFIIVSKIIQGKNCTVITAKTDIGILYGVFHFIRLLQTQQDISNLNIVSSPKIKYRLLNHWDNLNGTMARLKEAMPALPFGIGINYQIILISDILIMPEQMLQLVSTALY
ncbi:MAG: alpha-glucuronidase family glycosyl hydrolase [Ferruginibacter sp.]